jgi:tetratricopeptide (TPR) repeat protein
MKQEINYSRYVDRYLDGVMAADEKIWFEKELECNDDLQSEVSFQKKMLDVLSDKEALDLNFQLEEIHAQTYKPWGRSISMPERSKRTIYILGSMAATIAILMVVWLNLTKNNISSSELYAEYYQPAEINMSFRTAEDIVDSDLRSAMLFYENKDYSNAIALFEKILSTDESRIGLNLYSGISYMELSHYAEANENFKKIIDHKANAFIESAQWYLGLCYLKTGEVDKADEIFRAISTSEGYYKKEAKKVLKKIKS